MKRIVRDEVIYSNEIAIADDRGNKVTYKEMTKTAEKLSKTVEKRSIVLFLCDHKIETLEFLYEVLYLNRIPLLFASDIAGDLLDYIIKVYKPQYIYCERRHEIIDKYSIELELDNHILLRTNEPVYTIHPDVAILLSTSGTTGSAKLVKLSYENIYVNPEYSCLQFGIQKGQKGLCIMPINFIGGLVFCLRHWHCGATLLVTEKSVICNEFRRFFERERINNFMAVPYIYRILQKIQFWDQKKLEWLNYADCVGERLPNSDKLELISLMKGKFWNSYGQTETTGLISSTNYICGDDKLESIGRNHENIKIMVDKETCELIVQGKSVCMGYAYNIEQLAEGDVNQGILHTGDKAYIDQDGYIYLCGRMTRYVKILGKRIGLDDIEKYLEKIFAGIEFACSGKDDHISIFYTDRKYNLTKKVPVLLDRKMKIPQKFVSCTYLEKIPRNKRGKVMYADLEE